MCLAQAKVDDGEEFSRLYTCRTAKREGTYATIFYSGHIQREGMHVTLEWYVILLGTRSKAYVN